jgi:hypothetical protein
MQMTQRPAAGNRVSQAQYGTGTITSVNEYHIVIEFDDGRTSRFVTGRVELTASATEAPVKTKKKGVRKKKVVVPAAVAPEVVET